MKTVITLVALVAAAALALPGESFAQRGMGGGMGGAYTRLYNQQTVETVSGQVLSIDKVAPRRGRLYGIHLMLKTADGEISVHLGPSWFIDRQTMKIAANDVVDVTGSRITYEGKPAIIAAQVKKGGETLELRDSRGFPLWSAMRSK
ncbi:MAG: DNA-binding protein [Gammaproteobacteria bacterium]|nr:DNA-binding protein [Gammaproteobacteria bacterium]